MMDNSMVMIPRSYLKSIIEGNRLVINELRKIYEATEPIKPDE